MRSRVARTEERRPRLSFIGGCLRFYRSRIGSENLHCGLAVVFVGYILPVERATCHIGLAHTGLLCGMSALRLGVLCPLHGESAGYVECTTAELSAYCPDPMGMCPFIFASVCYAAAFPYQIYRRVACPRVLALRRACCRRPIYEIGVHLAGRCGAFGTLSARSELRLISPRRWPFPLVAYLALLVRRNGSGGCLAQGVA